MNNHVQFRTRTPQSIFDTVARRYDFLNSLLSLGLDRQWRRQAALCLELPPGARILDVATGTASFALTIATLAPTDAMVIGCDLNEQMLAVGQERLQKARSKVPIQLIQCLGESLPFDESIFDAVTIAFAIDDMENRSACAQEMLRVLKPGGKIVLLELSLPDHPLFLGLYRIYLQLFPLVGRFFSRGGYGHLREEILAYRGRLAIKELLNETGFTEYNSKSLSGGLVAIHQSRKPSKTQ